MRFPRRKWTESVDQGLAPALCKRGFQGSLWIWGHLKERQGELWAAVWQKSIQGEEPAPVFGLFVSLLSSLVYLQVSGMGQSWTLTPSWNTCRENRNSTSTWSRHVSPRQQLKLHVSEHFLPWTQARILVVTPKHVCLSAESQDSLGTGWTGCPPSTLSGVWLSLFHVRDLWLTEPTSSHSLTCTLCFNGASPPIVCQESLHGKVFWDLRCLEIFMSKHFQIFIPG